MEGIDKYQNIPMKDTFGRAVYGSGKKGKGKLSIGGLAGFLVFLWLANTTGNIVYSFIMLFVVMAVVDGLLSVVRK